MKYREKTLKSGIKVFLGKNAENNDELVKEYKGKENIILHTVAPGSPFCVITSNKVSKKDIYEAGAICASKSQDWREHKSDIKVHEFTGKDVRKPLFFAKKGTWKVNKVKTLNIKKKDIQNIKW